jgi:hypothetical protein
MSRNKAGKREVLRGSAFSKWLSESNLVKNEPFLIARLDSESGFEIVDSCVVLDKRAVEKILLHTISRRSSSSILNTVASGGVPNVGAMGPYFLGKNRHWGCSTGWPLDDWVSVSEIEIVDDQLVVTISTTSGEAKFLSIPEARMEMANFLFNICEQGPEVNDES